MHNFWFAVGLTALVLSFGILPAVSGLWPWILLPALLSLQVLSFVGALQIVLFIIAVIAIAAGLYH